MHRRYPAHLYLVIAIVFGIAGCTNTDPEVDSHSDETRTQAIQDLPGELVAMKMRILNGAGYTFVKYLDEDGDTATAVYGPDGRMIPESAVPDVQPRVLGQELEAILNSQPGDAEFVADTDDIEVVIALREDVIPTQAPEEVGSATFDAQGNARVELNGQPVTDLDMRMHNGYKQIRLDADLQAREHDRRAKLQMLVTRNPALAGVPEVQRALDEGRASVTVTLQKAQIRQFVQRNQDIIAGVELAHAPENDLADAMKDTNIDPYALNYSSRTGGGIGVYMSEGGCPDPSHITNYYRISGSSTAHSENVSAIVRGVSPDSYVYCRGGFTLPTSTDLNGYNGNPRVYIETHSWSYGGTDDAQYRVYDRDFDNHVYDSAVAVFKSAGNYGDDNGYVSSPSEGLNLITVGNYDDSNDTIRASSSYLDPETGNEKPELVTPGTYICAGGYCGTGTSQAAPHAAGFAADLMSSYNWLQLKPYYLKASMLAGADKNISGGTDKVGVGGVNFYRNYYNGTNTWWEGGNGSFSYFDSIDYLPNNGYIDRAVHLDASRSNVRVALTWLNRGTYTYNNRTAAHPIGMDMDLLVYDPNGNVVASSASWDNPYELVSFDPTVTGEYRIRISRYANRDTNSKLHMGLAIDW